MEDGTTPRRVINGPAVTRRRLNLGWSRYEFARRSGVSVSYLKLLEGQPPAGKRWPSQRILRILADTLGCTTDDITVPAHSDEDEAAA